jgi:hypothetical protein
MTKLKIFSAACLAIALATSPALARGFGAGHGGGGGGAHFGGGGGVPHFAGGGMGGARFASGDARFGGGNYRGGGFRHGGYGPSIAAGVIAGAALGGYGYGYGYGDTSYYDDSYAYDPGPAVAYGGSYGAHNPNGFVCQPGTMFIGEDGRRHLCQ